jgi:hypothetical protein
MDVKPEFCVVHQPEMELAYYGTQLCREHRAAADAILDQRPNLHEAVVDLRQRQAMYRQASTKP